MNGIVITFINGVWKIGSHFTWQPAIKTPMRNLCKLLMQPFYLWNKLAAWRQSSILATDTLSIMIKTEPDLIINMGDNFRVSRWKNYTLIIVKEATSKNKPKNIPKKFFQNTLRAVRSKQRCGFHSYAVVQLLLLCYC